MICYKDITFCPFWIECKDGSGCRRRLTQKVEDDAVNAGIPIMEFTEKPECFVEGEGK